MLASGAVVQLFAFDREPVVGPELFDMNQSALTLAKNQMLQRRDRQEFVLVEHVRDS